MHDIWNFLLPPDQEMEKKYVDRLDQSYTSYFKMLGSMRDLQEEGESREEKVKSELIE